MAKLKEYPFGQTIIITASFRVPNPVTGVLELTNPTTLVLTVRKPDGTSSTPGTTHPSIGVYKANVTLDQVGVWGYRLEGTGAAQAVAERQLRVTGSLVLP